jgi:hypothetical protein
MNPVLEMSGENETNPVWFQMRITKRQLAHLEMLCRFHLQLSENDRAKDGTRKLLYCLERWPHKETT